VILVIAEQHEGQLNRATWETLVAAQALAGDMPIKTVVVGGSSIGEVPKEIANAGVGDVLVAQDTALHPYTPDGYVMALGDLIRSLAPAYVLLPHTYQTRDFAPLLAARMEKPLITDVTGIKGTGTGATFMRPMFQGKLTAEVRPAGDPTWFITFQIGSFRADQLKKGAAGTVTPASVVVDKQAIRQQPEARNDPI
jgi:electron transfer flavoprotein alpha subunit